MTTVTLLVNGEAHSLDVSPEMPLLWVLRDLLGLTGPKYGCGVGVCGACVSHLDGEAFRPCVTPVAAVAGRAITTIEGLGGPEGLHPLQRAWLAEDVAQCGYCQAGQIMAAAALFEANPRPTDAEIDTALADNICRCGTYQRVRRAIRRAAQPG
jgi:aerobic-type carbon monoxide dehydrogenase small subunit (CoxS/CutS family)